MAWHGALPTHLLEHAIAVANTVAPTRQVQSGDGIKEAGSQAAQATVAQSRVALLLLHGLDVIAQGTQSIGVGALQAQVEDRVGQRPAHQKLSRQVVHELGVLSL